VVSCPPFHRSTRPWWPGGSSAEGPAFQCPERRAPRRAGPSSGARLDLRQAHPPRTADWSRPTENGYVLDGLGKLVDGWLDTGDLAQVDSEGFVQLSGRAKDLIIRGGHNIDPTVVEDALLAHPQVAAAAAVGRPDPHAGEVPVAYVALAPGARIGEDELCSWARIRVAEPAAAPKAVTVLDAVPFTDVGKPYKLPLRADVTRRAVLDALTEISLQLTVDAQIEDGAVIITVVVAPQTDPAAVEAILSRYAITWELRPGDEHHGRDACADRRPVPPAIPDRGTTA
jgi:hypothetical protein